MNRSAAGRMPNTENIGLESAGRELILPLPPDVERLTMLCAKYQVEIPGPLPE